MWACQINPDFGVVIEVMIAIQLAQNYLFNFFTTVLHTICLTQSLYELWW